MGLGRSRGVLALSLRRAEPLDMRGLLATGASFRRRQARCLAALASSGLTRLATHSATPP